MLPSLHQQPHKLPKSDGTVSDFADDLKKLKGFGNKNKSSVAELLFQFFRFYAHEFDYDKNVLSVRLGKIVSKTEKKWHYAVNNQLCVEEPFNTSRNLGNTADEYSFRGLHMELRRAFDLISQAKLEDACEQYTFPKEEERVWSRPPPQSRPVLLRSSSQTHSGRGGRGNHRGGRHNNNNNFHRGGGGSSRRSSSSVPATYDTSNMFMQPVTMPQEMQWYQNSQFQFQYAQQDLMTQIAYQENIRQMHHLYAQNPAYMQQAMGQHRMSATSSSSGQQHQSSDRSRTNSFDNPPLTAPLRPDLYALYGMTLAQPYFPQAYGTYPSSPGTTNGAIGTNQDFRRPLQRSTDTGTSGSSSSLRSHSQPASRSPPATQPAPTYFTAPIPSSIPSIAPRNANGVPIPSFMSDDGDFDETPKARSDSPQSEEGKYNGYYGTDSSSPSLQVQQQQSVSNGIAFGDLANQSSSPGRRRLSTDQLPQTILDRRMRRTSRSPSPLGHARAFSTSTSTASAPLASTTPLSGNQNKNSTRPLVVSGSSLKKSMTPSPRKPSAVANLASEESVYSGFDNPLQINSGNPIPMYPMDTTAIAQPSMLTSPPQSLPERPPVVVNGSHAHAVLPAADDPSFRERIAMMHAYYLNSQAINQEQTTSIHSRLSPSARQRLTSRQGQNGVIAPLDLAITENRMDNPLGADLAHLSPVYETRTPSPTVVRRFSGFGRSDKSTVQLEKIDTKVPRSEGTQSASKADDLPSRPQEGQKVHKQHKTSKHAHGLSGSKESGHTRAAKSESDNAWQKAGKGKKKAPNGLAQQGHSEQLPLQESERKGG